MTRNERRAERISQTLEFYADVARGDGVDNPEDDLRDLLADVMHYCRMWGLDFGDLLRWATMNFECERMDKDDNTEEDDQ
jgi:hypothetical protein